jgi:hypothetical protein
MMNMARPRRKWLFVISLMLRVYIVLFLIGCAGGPPSPGIEEIRRLQTKIVTTDQETVMNAAVGVLQDMNYMIFDANPKSGLITAIKETTEMTAGISEESGGTPTWLKVAVIVTGVILIVLIIAAISGGDDDEEKEYEEYHYDSPDVDVASEAGAEYEGLEYYRYRVSIKIDTVGASETRVRMSMHGTKLKGEEVLETGPVYDAEFYEQFWTGLESNIAAMQPDEIIHEPAPTYRDTAFPSPDAIPSQPDTADTANPVN